MPDVSANYLDRIRYAVRRSASEQADAEITDLIRMARSDMISKGIPVDTAQDETDPRVLGCVRCFCRWQIGYQDADTDRNADNYDTMVQQLRLTCGKAVSDAE